MKGSDRLSVFQTIRNSLDILDIQVGLMYQALDARGDAMRSMTNNETLLLNCLISLVDAHDDEPKRLTETEWQDARDAIRTVQASRAERGHR